MSTEDIEALKREIKLLKRENRKIIRDNELLRLANDQTARAQEFIQKENYRQNYYNNQILRTTLNIIILTDDHLNVKMVSNIFFRFSKHKETEISLGLTLEDMLKGEFPDDALADFMIRSRAALAGETIYPYVVGGSLNGNSFHMQIGINPMITDDGKIMGLNIVFVNMTEIAEARERAEAANKAKSAFLANMSHEIRTPINTMLGMNEMIIREAVNKDVQGYAENISRAGKTLLSLVDEILDFTKVEKGKLELYPSRYELGSMINDLINMIQGKAEEKGLTFEVDIDPGIPHELYGDEVRIKQCISNLLDNSVKYTKQGTVKLGIGYHTVDEDHISLEIYVSDTGIGMKQEDMERVFSPFTSMDEIRTGSAGGSGLGMSITKDILELMGTSLSVDSVYGKGSTFSFDVVQKILSSDPIGRMIDKFSQSDADKKKKYKALFSAPDVHLLVVDDTDTNLLVIRGLLKNTGVQIDTVLSGEEAIASVNNNDYKYDVIFIDHMMPGMDGIETLERLKRLAGDDDPTVYIALTANAITGAREKYLEKGFDDYLSKPVDGEALERMLMRYIPESKQRTPADDSPEIVPGETTDKDIIPRWIYDIPGLDVESGIKNCGGEDSFLRILKTFYETLDQKKREIIGYFFQKDLKGYTIRVHAMKSSSRIIGAGKISALSEQLEAAGDAGDITFIENNNDALIGLLDFLQGRLVLFDEVSDDLISIDDKQLRECYQCIYESSQMMDFGMVESILDQVKEYKLKSADEVIIKEVNDHLMQLDWDSLVELVKDRF